MGNVFAADVSSLGKGAPAAAPGAIPGLLPAPPPTAQAPKDKEESTSKSSTSQNPGPFEDLHKKCKDVFPINWEGAKLLINKGLSNHFQVSHTINMSSMSGSGYKFGATYVGTKQYGPSEAFPVLIGEMDPNGDLNANIIHQPMSNLRIKFVGQMQKNKFAATQLTSDLRGEDFTASLTLGNPDIINDSGVVATQYLQRVTDNLALGAELVYQKGQQVPGGQFALVSLGGKYSGSNWQASGQLGSAGLHCCYHLKCNEQIQCGVEVETSLRMMDSTATFGYQIDLPKANLVFRGMVDSNWLVGGVLEKRLQPLPFTLALSGMINHAKNQSRFGLGLIIG